jgi:hypothetical protein
VCNHGQNRIQPVTNLRLAVLAWSRFLEPGTPSGHAPCLAECLPLVGHWECRERAVRSARGLSAPCDPAGCGGGDPRGSSVLCHELETCRHVLEGASRLHPGGVGYGKTTGELARSRREASSHAARQLLVLIVLAWRCWRGATTWGEGGALVGLCAGLRDATLVRAPRAPVSGARPPTLPGPAYPTIVRERTTSTRHRYSSCEAG